MRRPSRRHGEEATPRANLAPLSHDYHYRIEMIDGEVLRGALIDITPEGAACIRLNDGAVVRRPCGRMMRLTQLEEEGSAARVDL